MPTAKPKGLVSQLLKPFTDWQAEEPSVMDKPWEEPARKITKVIGSILPTGLPEPSSMPVGGPLVSMFKDKAARELATKEFLNDLDMMERVSRSISPVLKKAMGPFKAVGQEFATRYPRVAAHMRLTPFAPPNISGESFVRIPSGQVSEKMPYGLTAKGYADLADPDPNTASALARDYIFHEGTHAAQALGNKDAAKLYQLAEDYIRRRTGSAEAAYDLNPFETSAWRRGLLESGNARVTGPVPVGPILQHMTTPTPNTPDISREIAEILKRRSEKGEKGIVGRILREP
jgi:hypothetical protein